MELNWQINELQTWHVGVTQTYHYWIGCCEEMFSSNGEHEDKQNPRLQSWYKPTACLTQAGEKAP